MSTATEEKEPKESLNFIEIKIEEDIANNKHGGKVQTRFPPEPNGFLHIGHAKSIVVNFGIAQKYQGACNLRFDDTNPLTEDTKYVEAIKKDIEWLGYKWNGSVCYTSDYFDQLYEFAIKLIKAGLAYVDDSDAETIAKEKGTPTQPGVENEYRSRSIAENLQLFEEMRQGNHPNGSKVLRAKIDMASPNMHLRDPYLYRIITDKPHHRTGDKWKIYPTYDFAHGQSDAIEEVTHSLCTLEFEVHRPLYEWLIEKLGIFPSKQTEFARLNLSYTMMSKRNLRQLVNEQVVDGWDDPRMPTISALRRRGYTSSSIRNFAEKVGVARRENLIDVSLLEHSIREDLNKTVPRVMAVLKPLKVVITNYPEDKTETLVLENSPEDESLGKREVPFGRELYIEQDDFMEDAPKKFFRLAPEREVRLKGAYIIKCEEVIKDDTGKVIELRCTYDENSKSGEDTSGKKVKGVLHWVSASHAIDAEVRLYDRLFNVEQPGSQAKKEGKEFTAFLNPDSLEILQNCKLEPSLKSSKPGDQMQFQRLGYFCVDTQFTTNDKLVFNRTVSLKDGWAKKNKPAQNQPKQGQPNPNKKKKKKKEKNRGTQFPGAQNQAPGKPNEPKTDS
ncbi:glutamine--tRNA ligase/YqeY domain fusion protein [Microscilla marina]|uniref:Glutamine--tRNA ligase n=1 Tax=Microscilla marina ATCC 23134 TaxID=313606 RepID=A1ZJN5_MICM2|nr:glutamine--tRNA ligase/YqeY domain fusion protein [Microscilla marina]EAY29338.1 glutaminyl-tRNA synthetase [Microscilla marina ATCC 23134]